MDQAITVLFSWEFLLFSFGIFTIIWIIRSVIEYFIPTAIGSKLWEKLILPIAPTLIGMTIAYFATKFPYPDSITSVSGRIFFGLTAGNLSSSGYQVLKGMIFSKIQSFNTTTISTTTTPDTTIIQSNSTSITGK